MQEIQTKWMICIKWNNVDGIVRKGATISTSYFSRFNRSRVSLNRSYLLVLLEAVVILAKCKHKVLTKPHLKEEKQRRC